MKADRRGIFINNGFMALHGAATVMIGTTLPEMIRAFDLSLARGGLIVSAQSAGAIVAMFAGLTLADRLRKPVAILLSAVLVGLLLGTAGLARFYTFLVLVFFLLGIAAQSLDLLLNAHTGDITPGSRTRALNVLHMLYGIGAFVGPTMARWLLDRSLSWNAVYWIVGALYLVLAAVTPVWARDYGSTGRKPDPALDVRPAGAAVRRVASAPERWIGVVLLGSVVMFYAVHQVGTNAWLPLYLRSTVGMSPAVSSAGLSVYWIGVILGRFLTSRFGARLGELRLLIWGTILGAVAVAGALAVGVPTLTFALFSISGLFTGATIPLAMTLAYGQLPNRTGSVTAVVYGLMVVGRLAGPIAIGWIGDQRGLAAGLLVTAVALVAGAATAIVVFVRQGRSR